MTRVAVIVYPGSNCDDDMVRALEVVGAVPQKVWHKEAELPKVDGVVLPGGFSYGDYLRSGAIARFSPISTAVADFADKGGPVIGVCNGFQILTELGLLPGALVRNASLKFVCRDQWLKRAGDRGLLAGCRDLVMAPIAHHDGAYFADDATLDELEGEGRVAFRYCDSSGESSSGANPNGSLRDIAGVISKNGRVLGMMPHPERNAEPVLGDASGRSVLESWLGVMEAA